MLEGGVYLAVGAGAGDVVSFSAGAGGLRHVDLDMEWVECGGCFGLGFEKSGVLGVWLVGEMLGRRVRKSVLVGGTDLFMWEDPPVFSYV